MIDIKLGITMAAKIGFNEKIASLLAYGEGLRQLPPEPAEGFVVPGLVDPDIWHADPDPEHIRQAESLEDALKRLGHALGHHARWEYGPRGQDFSSRDLRRDTDAERQARSRVLAAITRPTSFEEIDEGALAINNFFARMLAGAQIDIEPFSSKGHTYPAQQHSLNVRQAVFAVFKPELQSRTLRIQYHTPRVVTLPPPQLALSVPLHHVVSGEGVSIS